MPVMQLAARRRSPGRWSRPRLRLPAGATSIACGWSRDMLASVLLLVAAVVESQVHGRQHDEEE